MKAIIIRRLQVPDASLLLHVLSENGKIEKLKIPGILKSNRRSAYFLAPATIWDFTINGNPREIMTPKESKLLLAPYDIDSLYSDLEILGKLIKPLRFMRPELVLMQIYDDLEYSLKQWRCGNRPIENFLLNHFYLAFLGNMGLLHASDRCIYCESPLNENDSYHLFSGSTCRSCLATHVFRNEELIPNLWVLTYLKKYQPEIAEVYSTSENEFRDRILSYMKHAL